MPIQPPRWAAILLPMDNNPIGLNTMQVNKLIRAKECAALFGVSVSTWWNWNNPKSRHHRADLPRPIKVGENSTAWLESEISDYIGNLAANNRV